MCTQCRHDLDQSYMTEKVKKECDAMFQWLYDVNFIHTSSVSTSDSCHMLSQSFNTLAIEEKREHLKKFLEGNFRKYELYLSKQYILSLFAAVGCFDPVPSTNSFVKLQPSSKQRFLRQSTTILKSILSIMTPHDDVDHEWQTNIETSKQRTRVDKAIFRPTKFLSKNHMTSTRLTRAIILA